MRKHILITLGLCTALCGAASLALAQEQTTDIWRVDNTETQQIDKHGTCQDVTNNRVGGEDIMVPVKTTGEWSAFRDNLPTGVTLDDCGPSCTITTSDMTLEGSVASSLGDGNLDVSGNYAYVVSGVFNRLTSVDISAPASPSVADTLDGRTDDDMNELAGAKDVAVSGNYAYVAAPTTSSLAVIDISTPTVLALADNIEGDTTNLNAVSAVAISGSYLYAVGSGTYFTVVDISTPTSIVVETSITDSDLSFGRDIAISGNYAYVAASTADALTIVDISDPTSPSVVGSVTDTDLDGANGVAVSGNYAYVASATADSLTVVDISTPASPSVVGSVTDTDLDGASGVAYSSYGYAFVTGPTADSLVAVDVSTPASPAIDDTYTDATNLDSPLGGVAVDGQFVYATSFGAGKFTVIDNSCTGL